MVTRGLYVVKNTTKARFCVTALLMDLPVTLILLQTHAHTHIYRDESLGVLYPANTWTISLGGKWWPLAPGEMVSPRVTLRSPSVGQ